MHWTKGCRPMAHMFGGGKQAAARIPSLFVVALTAAALGCGADGTTSPAPNESAGRAISGQLVAAGDVGPFTRVKILLRGDVGGVKREFSGFAAVSGAFRFDADLPATSVDSLDLIVDVDGGPRTFAPVVKRIASNDANAYQRPLLIAKNVAITSGTYAGSTVSISLDDAFKPICADASSAACLAYFGLWQDVPVLWPEEAFPIPMAFFRRAGSPEITAEDSTVFWANVANLEAEFGRDLFRPVDISALGAVSADGLPERGNAVSLDPAAAPALAGAWRGEGRLIFARTRAASNVWLRQRYVMNHELIHVLGFGHTCSWESLMCGVSPGRPGATRSDVAAFLLSYLIDTAVRTKMPTTTLADALLGERTLAR